VIMVPYAWYAIVAGIISVTSFVAGFKIEGWRRDAREKAAVEKAVALKEKELERVDAVSASYQKLIAELRRVQTGVNKEVYRETQKVEYRCPVPDSARMLVDRAVTAANQAATGPAHPVPDHPKDDGTRLR